MKRLLILTFVISISATFAAAQAKYSTYNNPRFSFSIEYPSDLLKMQPPSANGDGRIFRSKDAKIEVRAWGQFNALGHTLKEEYDDAVNKNASNVTYKLLNSNNFVVSGIENGRIFYRKMLFRKSGETEIFYTVTIEYPASQKNLMDAVVTRISRSFKFDPNAEI